MLTQYTLKAEDWLSQIVHLTHTGRNTIPAFSGWMGDGINWVLSFFSLRISGG